MQKLTLLKILQQFPVGVVAVKPDERSLSQSNAGFTVIEVVIVAFIIGILSVSAVPSWFAFTNQRRVNVANDAVFRALQEAQRSAQKTKRRQSVSFKTDVTTKVPQIAFHLGSDSASSWKPLGADLQLKPEKIWMRTNFTSNNTPDSSLPPSTQPPSTITFDYMGSLPDMSTSLKVVVALRPASDSALPADSTKRCVIVQTLLGSIRTAKGSNCN